MSVEEMTQALTQLRLLTQQQSAQIARLESRGAQSEDLRLGKPSGFSGDEAKFDDWDMKFRAWIGCTDRAIAVELLTSKQSDIPLVMTAMEKDAQQRASKVYFSLIMLCEDSALRIVRSTSGDNGYEAYRLLSRRFDPRSKSRSLARLNAILTYEFGAKPDEVLDKILGWERCIGDYERDSKETVGDSLKSAVLVGKLPMGIRTHVLLHPTATQDYQSLRGLIESYILSGRRWEEMAGTGGTSKAASAKALQDQSAPMEVDMIKGKGKGKGKKGKGKGKKGKKGKGDGKDSPKEEKASAKDAAAAGAGASGAYQSKKFDGHCGHCGLWGHRQRDCWWKPAGAQPGVNSIEADPAEQPEEEGDGWLLATCGADDAGASPEDSGSESVWLLVDSAASVHVCGQNHFPQTPLEKDVRADPRLRTADGRYLEYHGVKRVVVWLGPKIPLQLTFVVTSARRVILSAGLLADDADITTITDKKRPRMEYQGHEIELTRFGALTFLKCPVTTQEVNDVDDRGEEEHAKHDQEQLVSEPEHQVQWRRKYGASWGQPFHSGAAPQRQREEAE